jgi:hypothetical protein
MPPIRQISLKSYFYRQSCLMSNQNRTNFSRNPIRMRKIHLALLALICVSSVSKAQFRKYSNEFLNIGVGARGLAMGSAQVASVNDGTAGYWNPAGLAFVKNPNINAMHAEYFSGIGKYDYASAALPLAGGKRTLGITALRFGVDDIPNTLFLVEPDGTINYNNIRTFSSADYGFIFSLAQQLKETKKRTIQVGINAKVIHRSVGSFAKAWGFGIDGGVQMQVKKWLFGVAGRDITTTFNTWSFNFSEKEKEALYLTNNEIPIRSTELTAPRLILGAARNFKLGSKSGLLVELNADLTFDGKRNTVLSSNAVSVDPKLGIEANINKTLFLRAGINNFQQALADKDTLNQKKVWIYQPGIGAGFNLQNIRIDYAFTNLANQSSGLYTHIFSLQLNLVNDKKKKAK